jgi:hypothetical protein
MSRPCTCDRCGLTPWADYRPGDCRLCWLYHHDPDYQQLWQGTAAAPALSCRHLGAPTGATVACAGCGGSVALKLFHCAVHGYCTPARQVPAVACCATCPDRDPSINGENG